MDSWKEVNIGLSPWWNLRHDEDKFDPFYVGMTKNCFHFFKEKKNSDANAHKEL